MGGRLELRLSSLSDRVSVERVAVPGAPVHEVVAEFELGATGRYDAIVAACGANDVMRVHFDADAVGASVVEAFTSFSRRGTNFAC